MWRRLLSIVFVGAVLLLLAEIFGPGGVQRRGMKAANVFRQSIAPILAADPRFAEVKMSVGTSLVLFVHGDVPDEQALEDLRRLVQPPPESPFRVQLSVFVRGEPATRSAG